MNTSETAPKQLNVEKFLQTWTEVFAQVLGEIAGSPVPCAFLAEPLAQFPVAAGNDLWLVAGVSGTLRGEMCLRLPQATAVRLAQIFMSEPAAPVAELTPDYREAVVELLRQVSGRFATAAKTGWGEVQIQVTSSPAAPSWAAASSAWLRFGEEATPFLMEIQLSAALLAALRAEKQSSTPEVNAPPSAVGPGHDTVKLDLLMEVQLGVTLRFGSRRLLLREVLDLNPGEVIELDRQVQDPVDMLLDNRTVARGEVVVLDGQYGLRITEVPAAN